MERKTAVERLYSLGQFQNVKFTDEITGIPEHIALNADAMKLITYSQLLEVESNFYKYTRLRLDVLPKGKLEEVITDTLEALEQEQSRTWEQLLQIINEKTHEPEKA